ncbi:hypothetical protein [Paludisphaera rhizosphaerae]|uniref:hypothetical protein n=1 Tax=Paludisphaera rhizosphaerae TaxID=2711216 RepID=UPI0013EA540F|nr:hypothetical protein [Paludisphaera rhizosphaerae]
MSLVRIATVGCLFLAAGICGCGDGTNSGGQPAPAADAPNAGVEASKSIMNMQPPSPAKAGKKAH